MWGFRAEKRLLALEEGLEKLERAFQGVRMEWDDAYHRLSKMMGRIAKSEAKIAADREPQEETPLPNGPATGFLSDRQKTIQQQVLRRRAGLR